MSWDLCYTHESMQTESFAGKRSTWSEWASFLRQRRLESFTAWLLDAFAPLTVLGAQFIYLGSSFLRPAFSAGQIESLALLLEDPAEARAFAAYLREEEIK